MLEAYKDYWTRYTDFSGKTGRSEYWYAILMYTLVNLVLVMVLPKGFYRVWLFANLLPIVAMGVRRLRSAGKNPSLYALAIIPLVNLYVLYLLVQPDQK